MHELHQFRLHLQSPRYRPIAGINSASVFCFNNEYIFGDKQGAVAVQRVETPCIASLHKCDPLFAIRYLQFHDSRRFTLSPICCRRCSISSLYRIVVVPYRRCTVSSLYRIVVVPYRRCTVETPCMASLHAWRLYMQCSVHVFDLYTNWNPALIFVIFICC
jgi:hypothetical protein